MKMTQTTERSTLPTEILKSRIFINTLQNNHFHLLVTGSIWIINMQHAENTLAFKTLPVTSTCNMSNY